MYFVVIVMNIFCDMIGQAPKHTPTQPLLQKNTLLQLMTHLNFLYNTELAIKHNFLSGNVKI